MIEDIVKAQGGKPEVEQLGPQVGEQQQAEHLPQGPALGPRRRVHIGSEKVTVCSVQHVVHGSICSSQRGMARLHDQH